jgi:hypothetical protein
MAFSTFPFRIVSLYINAFLEFTRVGFEECGSNRDSLTSETLKNVTCRILFPNHWIWKSSCEEGACLDYYLLETILFDIDTGRDGESEEVSVKRCVIVAGILHVIECTSVL